MEFGNVPFLATMHGTIADCTLSVLLVLRHIFLFGIRQWLSGQGLRLGNRAKQATRFLPLIGTVSA